VLCLTLNASISNYLQALADTGIWRNNSIFLSSDFLNSTLQPNDVVSVALSLDSFYQSYFPDYHNPLRNISGAEILRTNPFPIMGVSIRAQQPSSILVGYTCHSQRQKWLPNFIICIYIHLAVSSSLQFIILYCHQLY
jgi:hypothetical protein